MPELPEVEVVKRGLQASVQGRGIRQVLVRQPQLRWPIPGDLDKHVSGARVLAVNRRSKYLLLSLSSGTLIIHLGMSGSLQFQAQPGPAGRHDHVDLVFEHGVLRYCDPRRFGAILWHQGDCESLQSHALFSRLGVEPFDEKFNAQHLFQATRGRKLSIKQLLLSGSAVVGVGNIYASESLFRAGIRPSTPAGRLSRPRCAALVESVRQTLAESIERGGSTLRDFVDSEGRSGYFQLDCFVYGRAQQPCRRCSTPVRLSRDQQRSTFWCPVCQR